MENVKIESGIKIPQVKRGRPSQEIFPFGKMRIGDSFEIAGPSAENRLRYHAKKFQKNNPKFKFMVRKTGIKSARIWKI